MKRLLLSFVALAGMAVGAWADGTFQVGGVDVTDANKDDLTAAINESFPGHASGTITYDSDTHTLSLNAATLGKEDNGSYHPILWNNGQDLVIDVTGDCKIMTGGSLIPIYCDQGGALTIKGTGTLTLQSGSSTENSILMCAISSLEASLTIDGITVTANGSIMGLNSGGAMGALTIKNATVSVASIFDFGSITLNQAQISAPAGAVISGGSITDGGATAENVSIVPVLNLMLDGSADNASTIAANAGKTGGFTLGGRTLAAGKWNSLCLPFDLTAEQIAASPLAGATIRTLDSYANDGTTVTIAFADAATIEAGKPYIVKFEGEDKVNPTFEDVTISAATASVTKGDATFTGTYAPVTLTDGDTKKLFLQGDKLYYPAGGNATVGAFRGYFTLTADVPTSSGAKIIVDFGDEEATGVSTPVVNPERGGKGVYTLQGARLGNVDVQSLPKGVYIVNGKKVVTL